MLRELLLSNKDIDTNLCTIENYFIDFIRDADLGVLDQIKLLSENLSGQTVAELCGTLGHSRKRLWQLVIEHFGSPVKEMQGIIRFDRHLESIAKSENTLSSLHSFYDQAHFINDFKKRTGLTPRQYKKLCTAYPETIHHPNFIPVKKETFLQFYRGGIL